MLNSDEIHREYIDIPVSEKPNKITLDAHDEALREGGTLYISMEDFWTDMGINRTDKKKLTTI